MTSSAPTGPGLRAPTSTTTFGPAHARLYGEYHAPAGVPKGTVLIVHGYADHGARYREVAAVMADAGWAAFAVDLRGHGQSFGRRGYIDRWADYGADVDAAWTEALRLSQAPARRLQFAHSNGALITLEALAANPRRWGLERVLLSSPFLALRLAVPGVKRAAATVASKLWPSLALPNGIAVDMLTRDPARRALRASDTLANANATARWFTEASAAQARATDGARRIEVPSLWVIGAADKLADAEHSLRVAGTVPAAQVHPLAGFEHEVWNDLGREQVFDLIRAFIS